MDKLKGVCIGTGYFSKYHYSAWLKIPEVEIVAFSSLDGKSVEITRSAYGIQRFYKNYQEMLVEERPDFVDIITPPASHDEICRFAADLGIHIICQKPLTPEFEKSMKLINDLKGKVRFIIHENFRFQPWHREIKKLLVNDEIGQIFNLNFRSRMGDGWGENAYLDRQPYFRDYERLLIYETGVHFIDVFRYHAGEVRSAYALLRKLNPVVKGEDCAIMILEMENNAVAVWDANRYNENSYEKDRFTFGEYLLEGDKGTIRLYSDGTITLHPLGGSESIHDYYFTDEGFAGNSCYNFQKQAIECLLSGKKAETEADEYMKTIQVQEAVYTSAGSRKVVSVSITA